MKAITNPLDLSAIQHGNAWQCETCEKVNYTSIPRQCAHCGTIVPPRPATPAGMPSSNYKP